MPRRLNFVKTMPLLVVIFAMQTAVSCGARNNFPSLDAESDDAFLRYGTEWAVVTEPYAVFRARPDINEAPGGYGRRGDVEQITGRAVKYTGTVKSLWYRFDKGWLPWTSVTVYSNKLRAQKASANLK